MALTFIYVIVLVSALLTLLIIKADPREWGDFKDVVNKNILKIDDSGKMGSSMYVIVWIGLSIVWPFLLLLAIIFGAVTMVISVRQDFKEWRKLRDKS